MLARPLLQWGCPAVRELSATSAGHLRHTRDWHVAGAQCGRMAVSSWRLSLTFVTPSVLYTGPAAKPTFPEPATARRGFRSSSMSWKSQDFYQTLGVRSWHEN